MKDARGGFRFSYAKWALYAPILFLVAGVGNAAGQCSQAGGPGVAATDQAANAARVSPAPAADESSSSDTPGGVRFVTGSAVTVLEDTPLQVRNDMAISSRNTKAGDRLSFTVTRDVVVGGILVIPCGAIVTGTMVEAKQAGRLVGASNLTLQLTALNLDGKSYPLYAPPFKVVGASKTRPTVYKTAAGAAVGALVGDASMPRVTVTDMDAGKRVSYTLGPADQAKADAVYAGVGAGVGLAVAASSPPSIAVIPAESQFEFTLALPIAVYPVDQRTAVRLAEGMHHGPPALYVRGEIQ
ncbi:hypothetical protein [Occallatibacter riparius]|uniref:Uncharacterized protein n=1 Tax=Occallatibacter riparius TaxID=1002689 RepID=A0A9J7BLV9_9BACT|nr:hypothetical protein [Occallatibacter riparius]UWZ83868.1 hypothetical protein MOP44_25330 [Occallatibacter riparius]